MSLNPDMPLGIGTTFDCSIPLEPMLEMVRQAGFHAVTLAGGNIAHSGYDTPEGRHRILDLANRNGLRIDSVHAPYGNECDVSAPDEKVLSPAPSEHQALLQGQGAEVSGAATAPAEPAPPASQESSRTVPGALLPPRVTSRRSAERQQAIERLKNAIDAAEALNSGMVILHLTDRFPPEETRARISAVKDSLKELLGYAAKRNVRLAAENLPSALALQVFDAILEELPWLGVCYDSSHAQLSGDPFGVLQRYRDRLIALHLSDNRGYNDDHLLPFEGVIEWEELMNCLRQASGVATFMLEVEVRESAFKDTREFLEQARARTGKLLAGS